MIKLNYKIIEVEGITIYFAKYRKNRNIRLVVEEDNMVRLTCPYGVSTEEIYDFIKSKIKWVKKALNKISTKKRLSDKPELKKEEKIALKSFVDDIVYRYAVLMKIELRDVRLRRMKTEWGNCNYRDKVLTFNTYLYYMSESFIEAIVVHELAHLFYHGHGKMFYKFVCKYIPDYKERIKEGKTVSLK